MDNWRRDYCIYSIFKQSVSSKRMPRTRNCCCYCYSQGKETPLLHNCFERYRWERENFTIHTHQRYSSIIERSPTATSHTTSQHHFGSCQCHNRVSDWMFKLVSPMCVSVTFLQVPEEIRKIHHKSAYSTQKMGEPTLTEGMLALKVWSKIKEARVLVLWKEIVQQNMPKSYLKCKIDKKKRG